jgi:hypothetical protein
MGISRQLFNILFQSGGPDQIISASNFRCNPVVYSRRDFRLRSVGTFFNDFQKYGEIISHPSVPRPNKFTSKNLQRLTIGPWGMKGMKCRMMICMLS